MLYVRYLAQMNGLALAGEVVGTKEGGVAMHGPRMRGLLGLVTAMILGVLLQVAWVHPATAQDARASAEIRRAVGRVEILRNGQAQWTPAAVGARLGEGDGIRAFSGASADLEFPDGSTVVLAENSRLLLNKAEFDLQQQSRFVLLHLVVGKVRAAITQTAVTLARARQSNFVITTPTAVAAARGTVVWVFTDGKNNLIAVEPVPGYHTLGKIECITLDPTKRINQMVLAGSESQNCAAPVPVSPQFLTLSNPATVGANLGGPVVAPTVVQVTTLVTASGTGPAPAPTPVFSTFNPTTSPAPPSTLGVNQEVFAPPPTCATDPCN